MATSVDGIVTPTAAVKSVEAPAAHVDVVSTIVRAVSTFADAAWSPFGVTSTPTTPTQTPLLWAVLGFARREFGEFVAPQGPTAPTAVPVTTGLLVGDVASATANPAQPSQAAAATMPATFTGQPTIVTQLLVAGLRLLKSVGDIVGLNLGGTGLAILPSTSPPALATLGLNVQRSEFDGWEVWSISPPAPSGDYIVGLHGGGFALQPTLFHWIDYANIARNTGATVIVPIYPLVQEGGTAATVVPQTADFITSLMAQAGPDHTVSVYGDSAGANIALAATQELVKRGDPTPARLVLVSPPVDLSLTNPAISLIDDPVLDPSAGAQNGLMWSGGDLFNPQASPLFGSLAGFPPTYVYAGSLEILAPDVLRLQDKAIEAGADFTFILRNGEIHDWAGPGSVFPFTVGAAYRSVIYQQLRGVDIS
jgi:acetyl esterase/lipase